MNVTADGLNLRRDTRTLVVIEKNKSLNLDEDALIYYKFLFYKGDLLLCDM